MKVLVACEESQRVCIAFRERAHEAYSCDIQEPSGGHPEWHILGDVLPILNPSAEWGDIVFNTMDGVEHCVPKWDMIIAHPPCTYLSNAGARHLYKGKDGQLNKERYVKGKKAKDFFMQFYNSSCERICIENPVPSRVFGLPQYSQIIQPYYFGDPWKKRTCLWLRGLQKLEPTNIVEPRGYWIGAHGRDKAPYGMIKGFRDQKMRSKTFEGIANAMAEQWGST